MLGQLNCTQAWPTEGEPKSNTSKRLTKYVHCSTHVEHLLQEHLLWWLTLQVQSVRFPRRSFTTPWHVSKHVQPLSNALPDPKSPRHILLLLPVNSKCICYYPSTYRIYDSPVGSLHLQGQEFHQFLKLVIYISSAQDLYKISFP